jgi:hypothetical protein
LYRGLEEFSERRGIVNEEAPDAATAITLPQQAGRAPDELRAPTALSPPVA